MTWYRENETVIRKPDGIATGPNCCCGIIEPAPPCNCECGAAILDPLQLGNLTAVLSGGWNRTVTMTPGQGVSCYGWNLGDPSGFDPCGNGISALRLACQQATNKFELLVTINTVGCLATNIVRRSLVCSPFRIEFDFDIEDDPLGGTCQGCDGQTTNVIITPE